MFLQNKYYKCYINLCESRQRLIRHCYLEKHHILPVSLGGLNTKINIVSLTAREHFLAHHLLIKCLDGENKRKMCYALSFFRTTNKNHIRKLTSRQYAVAREAHQLARSGVSPTQKCKDAVSKSKKGVPLSLSQKEKMRIALSKQRSFFYFDGEYKTHHDFYRFCTEHKIGRAALQKKMNVGIAVITAGHHKGKCFSFTDCGISEMQIASSCQITTANSNRSISRAAQQAKLINKKAKPSTIISIKNPSGNIMHFSSYKEFQSLTGKPWTSIQSCKQVLPWAFLNGQLLGWVLISKGKLEDFKSFDTNLR